MSVFGDLVQKRLEQEKQKSAPTVAPTVIPQSKFAQLVQKRVIQRNLQAGRTLSVRDMQNLGVAEPPNRKQRKVISDVMRRQSKFSAAKEIGAEMKGARFLAEQVAADKLPEARQLPLLSQLPGGLVGGLTRQIPIAKDAYVQQLREIRKGPGTEQEKAEASSQLGMSRVRERADRIQRVVQSPHDYESFQQEAQELKGKFLKKTYRRWERGSAMVVGGGLHLAEEITRVATLGKYGDAPAEQAKMYHDVLKRPEMQPVIENAFDKYFGGAIETGPFLGVALAPAALTGGATLPSLIGGFLTAYAVEGNNTYQNAKDRGASELTARIRGISVGIINGGIEIAGGSGGKYFKSRKAAAKAVATKLDRAKTFSRHVLKNALKEGLLEELPQEAVSMVVGGDVPRKKDGQVDYATTAERLTDAAVMGTILGGLVDAPISATNIHRIGKQIREMKPKSPEAIKQAQKLEESIQQGVEAVKPTPTTPEAVKVAPEPTEAAPGVSGKTLEQQAKELGIPTKGLTQEAIQRRVDKVQAEKKAGEEPSGGVAWHTAFSQALGKAKRVRGKVVAQQKATLRRQVGAAAGTLKGLLKKRGISAKEAISRSTAKLKGQRAQYEQLYEGVDEILPPETIEAAYRDVAETQNLEYFDRVNLTNWQGTGALDKLIAGTALTPGDVKLIKKWQPILGKQAESRVPWTAKAWKMLTEIMNIPRTTLAGFADLSGIGRQQRALGLANIPKYVKAVHATHKAFISQKATNKLQKEYENSEFYEEAKDVAKIDFTAHGATGEVSAREERYVAAPLLGRIPGVGRVFAATERAFVVPLNWLRMNVYSAVRVANPNMTESEMKVLGQAINDLSGRSSLGRVRATKKIAPLMAAFFSPRFALSRIKLPYTASKAVFESARRGQLKQDAKALITGETRGAFQIVGRSMAMMIAGNLALMLLLKMLWPDDTEIDPDLRSSDGGKIKIGNKRIDLWSGYLQPAQLFMRLATGQRKSQAGRLYDVDLTDTLESFARSKTAPLVGLALDLWRGKTFFGQKLGAAPRGKAGEFLTGLGVPKSVQGISKEIWNRLGPLTAQDAGDALADSGVPAALGMGALAFYGFGVQTYEDWPAAKLHEARTQAAQKEFGKPWDELLPAQQRRLKATPELRRIEAETTEERRAMGPGDYAKYIEKPLNDSARRMQRLLPKKIQTELELLSMTPGGVKRTIAKDFFLNDKRYETYEKYAVEEIKRFVTPLIEAKSWAKRDYLSRLAATQKQITRAKDRARKRVMGDIHTKGL